MEVLVFIVTIVVFVIWILHELHNHELISSATKSNRGNSSERQLVLLLRQLDFHPDAIYHDLYFQKKNGSFTQIDLVLATPMGLIVFEVKDYSGWLFGNGRNTYWTQVLSYGKEKYRVYNPVLQNQRHIEELRKASPQFSRIPMFSVVVFYGNCELKRLDNIPNNTLVIKNSQLHGALKSILENNPPAPYTDKYEIMQILSSAKSNGDDASILTEHIQYVEEIKRNQGSKEGRIRQSWDFNILPSTVKQTLRFLRKLR
jgi:hypothetical protein